MAAAFVVEILIIAFLLLVAAEVVAKFLPKNLKPVARGVALTLIGWNVYSSGILGDFKQTPPQNVATLLEQASGDQLHWDQFGKPATRWNQRNHRNYEETCQIYALAQLGELGPEARAAVPELVEIYSQLENNNTGDGVLHVQTTAGKTLGLIGHPDAISPLIATLRKKALSPELSPGRAIRWHDRTYELEMAPDANGRGNGGRSHLKRGTGPQGIMMALMLMPRKHHGEIVQQLNSVYAEIQQSELFNEWAKFEITRAIRFFEADKAVQQEVRDYMRLCWHIDDADFEKMMTREHETASVEERTNARVWRTN